MSITWSITLNRKSKLLHIFHISKLASVDMEIGLKKNKIKQTKTEFCIHIG